MRDGNSLGSADSFRLSTIPKGGSSSLSVWLHVLHTCIHTLWIVFALLPLLSPTPLTAVQLKMCSSFQVHCSHFTFSFLSPHMQSLRDFSDFFEVQR